MVQSKKMVQKKGWEITFFSSLNGKKIVSEIYSSIKELAKKHKQVSEETWRNISSGRSKIYDPFFKLKHINI
tara:strand:+ start:389 stop:604 length:216 start_codon:yes stop_codon:yes gene_type:complete